MPQYSQPVAAQPGKLKVVELFETVQGEGVFIGVPSIFFRTGACNLECSGCDTKWDSWTEESTEIIAHKILSFKSKHVVFTGGEPLLWQPELGRLAMMLENRIITVETNGAVPLTDETFIRRIDHFSCSPKVGSLGFGEKFSKIVVMRNLAKMRLRNQVKYVLDPNVPEHVDSVFLFQQDLDRPTYNEEGNFVQDQGGKPLMDVVGEPWDSEPIVPADRVFFQPYDRGTLVNIYARQVDFNINNEYNSDLAALTKLVMERSGSRFRVVPQLHKYITWR